MIIKKLQLLFLLVFIIQVSFVKGQEKEYVYQTFKDTRVINTYAVETLEKRHFDIRITHRFGDFINGWTFQNAWSTFLGLENAADVSFGLEYGITNNLTVGISRTKGFGPLKSNFIGMIKYKTLTQTLDNSMPITLTFAATTSLSTMWASGNVESLASFPKPFVHRLSYSAQVHVALKFGNVFALQLSPTFVWRNLVEHFDQNYSVGMGLCMRLQVSKLLGIILDANLPLDAYRWNPENGYYFPLGIGFEFDTGGHVFQINLTNPAGIEPTDYMPYTTLDWLQGQFRIGFTISRAFKV